MAKRTLETDYLVVGCGAAGMADALVTDSQADIAARDALALGATALSLTHGF